MHITPNTSEPSCGVCPSYECAPVLECPKDNKHYDTCATLWAEAGYLEWSQIWDWNDVKLLMLENETYQSILRDFSPRICIESNAQIFLK